MFGGVGMNTNSTTQDQQQRAASRTLATRVANVDAEQHPENIRDSLAAASFTSTTWANNPGRRTNCGMEISP